MDVFNKIWIIKEFLTTKIILKKYNYIKINTTKN